MRRSLLCAGFALLFVMNGEPRCEANAEATQSQSVKMSVRGDRGSKVNRLIIPKKLLNGATVVNADDQRDMRTIVAGVALSLAAVSLVFVFLRRKSAAAKAAAGGAAAVATMFLAGELATADIPPPRADVVRNWTGLAENEQMVIVEIVDEGDSIELVLGTYRKWTPPPEFRNRFHKYPPEIDRSGQDRKTPGTPERPGKAGSAR